MKNLLYVPMSGSDMLRYNPDARLYKYPDIYNYNTIDELFGHSNKIVLLYLTDTMHNGHWTGLFRKGNEITFFDSYGLNVDDEEHFYINPYVKEESGERYKYLMHLLNKSNYKINHNPYRLQGKNTETCGRFVTLRLLNTNLDNDQFYNMFFKTKKSPDEIVSELIK